MEIIPQGLSYPVEENGKVYNLMCEKGDGIYCTSCNYIEFRIEALQRLQSIAFEQRAKELPKTLIEMRNTMRLSQHELAMTLNTTFQQVINWETGKVLITPMELKLLSLLSQSKKMLRLWVENIVCGDFEKSLILKKVA
jgi:DNA-binding transcriptional regulator YiaG